MYEAKYETSANNYLNSIVKTKMKLKGIVSIDTT